MPAAQAWRTLRYSSTLKILAPSLLSQKGKGWTTFTPPAAAPCRRFRGLISHRRSQQQNAYVERYNRTVRHEWLDLYIFETIEEVQQIATEWLWTYNNERPNMGIGGVTPAMKLKMAA